MSSTVSRREFLGRSAFYGGSLWLSLHMPRPDAARAAELSSEPVTFTPEDWKTVEAMTARIIPSDADPGAVEAGCVNFIDKALANEDAAVKPIYAAGLPALAALCAASGEGVPFAALAPEQQDATLAALQTGAVQGWPDGLAPAVFFETVRVHTVIGFLADPKYGGNREYVGWKLLGYPGPRHERGGYTPAQMLGAPVDTVWGEEV
ncbi:MAG: gluconate 2-dehydrogenase subunit 3 family protein [Proteobacteria bacterium]|nr:gluconate 2-dehydrogenase subunit 3 family protein [Pseudomonadota bacterium]